MKRILIFRPLTIHLSEITKDVEPEESALVKDLWQQDGKWFSARRETTARPSVGGTIIVRGDNGLVQESLVVEDYILDEDDVEYIVCGLSERQKDKSCNHQQRLKAFLKKSKLWICGSETI